MGDEMTADEFLAEFERFRTQIEFNREQAMLCPSGTGFPEFLHDAPFVAAKALAQLPDGMKDCTIIFKECDKGHGWLTATNWVQHGCSTCERERLRDALTVALRWCPSCQGRGMVSYDGSGGHEGDIVVRYCPTCAWTRKVMEGRP